MKRLFTYTGILALGVFLLVSCAKEAKPYDNPFIYITDENGAASSTVDSRMDVERSYTVYISTKRINRDINVDFEITTGDGLTRGVDFDYITDPGQPLNFVNGLYERNIRIRLMPRLVEEGKDNAIKISLTGNSENFTVGMPGPDKLFSSYIIRKVNVEDD